MANITRRAGKVLRTVVLTTSQTWTPPAGVTKVDALIVAGGGGGGGSVTGSGGSMCGGGGGGGGVAYMRDLHVDGPVACVIGAGGTGGPGRTNTSTAAPGLAGGNTLFGRYGTVGGRGGGPASLDNSGPTDGTVWVGVGAGGTASFNGSGHHAGGGGRILATTAAITTSNSNTGGAGGDGAYGGGAASGNMPSGNGNGNGDYAINNTNTTSPLAGLHALGFGNGGTGAWYNNPSRPALPGAGAAGNGVGNASTPGGDADPNSGGGGGGATASASTALPGSAGGNGGSGVIILEWWE